MSEVAMTDKLSFRAEWFDNQSCILRKFYLHYFPYDDTIELYDINTSRTFLKRTQVENLELRDIFIGNTVTIFSRQVKVTDYANILTKRKMSIAMQKMFALIKSDSINHKSSILKMLCKNHFKITKMRMLQLPKDLAEELFEDSKSSPSFQSLVSSVTSSPVIAMELVGDNGANRLMELVGPEDPEEAKSDSPTSIRARFGKDVNNNVIHIETDTKKVQKASEIIFGPKTSYSLGTDCGTVTLVNSTCCIIKPHAVKAGHLGEIVGMIEENGYTITALEMFYLDDVNAAEFLEVYKFVCPEFPGMVGELTSGACVAMEISGPMGPETPIEFRKLVGPNDPSLAKQVRPYTIRAKFGVTLLQNAVHVTDLPEDAILEVEYFFKILNR